ncbi:hypothetical protein R6Q59_013972 [Mikania micrantha]
MPAVRHYSRINTVELKLQMERILGAQRSEKYFNLLTRYLSLKIQKSEFDKLCIRLIGRENIGLHNELIRAILKNAAVSKTPPPKQVNHDNPLTFKDPNGGLQSICREVFPQSPRKARTPNLHERKSKDRPIEPDETNHMVEFNSEQDASSLVGYRRIPIIAPYGINIHSNGMLKVSHNDSCSAYYTESCHYSGQFLSRSSLENRLKQKLKMKGLDVSMDSVDLLNIGLDSYLKRVVNPSLELARSRFLHTPRKRFAVSLLDFQMATMTNPKMLGEDWSIQLEKICSCGFDNK